MTRIIVFGDSITYGAYDKEGGWVDRLKGFVHEKDLSDPDYECLVYNLGVSGDTSEDLLERFEFETKQRMKEGEEMVFIFSIGENDSQFIRSKNGLRIPPESFMENIRRLIDLARKISPKIIFIGLLPVDESKTTPISWDSNKSYKNEYAKKYNEIVKSICKENGISFIEIFEGFIERDYKKLLEDGLHPNTGGHKLIFDIVKNFLVEDKVI